VSDCRTPDVSVVIPTCNNGATIEAQLSALAKQDFAGTWELLVVDNRSTDDTRAVATRWLDRLPQLRVIDAPDRQGVSYARNVGIRAARAPLVAFCDGDDVVDRSWLAEMVASSEDADVVIGRLSFELLNDPDEAQWRGFDANVEARGGPAVDCIWGGNFLARNTDLEAVGGFDEAFAAGGEDVDLDLRLRRKGATFTRNDEAILHYRVRSAVPDLARQGYRYGRSFALICKKHGPDCGLKRPISLVLKTWGWLIVNAWWLASHRRRGRWVWIAGRSAGRMSGSIKYRVMCL